MNESSYAEPLIGEDENGKWRTNSIHSSAIIIMRTVTAPSDDSDWIERTWLTPAWFVGIE